MEYPDGDTADFIPDELRAGVRELAPILYDDLRRVARSQRRKLFSPNTLATTALINEAFLKLHEQPAFRSHADFLRISAVTMRHLLIDRVRAQKAEKRGAELQKIAEKRRAELLKRSEKQRKQLAKQASKKSAEWSKVAAKKRADLEKRAPRVIDQVTTQASRGSCSAGRRCGARSPATPRRCVDWRSTRTPHRTCAATPW